MSALAILPDAVATGTGRRVAPPLPAAGGRNPDTKPQPLREGRPLEGLRVLVVEDEAIIAMDLELSLREFGAIVLDIAASGEDALRLAAALRPDFVTMDVRLEGAMDGIEAATEIRHRHGIPSLFVSAFAEPSILERARAAVPIGWVRKPFQGRALLAALEPFLASRS